MIILDDETDRRLRDHCQKNHVSVQQLGKSLIRSYLDHPTYRIVYKDLLFLERSDYKGPLPLREAIGWADLTADNGEVRIISDRAVTKFDGMKEPGGPNVLRIPKGCVVELRRTTSS